jgi:hypothetical protein
VIKLRRSKPAPPAVLPSAPPPPPVSGAIVETQKIEEVPKAKADERVAVTAAAPMLQPAVTARNSLIASDTQAAPAPQFRMEVQAPGARQIFYGVAQRVGARLAVSTGAPQPASLAVRYTILRRDASGALVEADRADLAPSDVVELRFTANTTGYLTVGDATPVSLTAMEPYTTPPLSAIPAELKIIFAPQPQRQATSAAAIVEVQYRDTYVANRLPGQPLTFTIKLP